ncbi:tyrosine-type recombinase/integrase [Porphyromonas loveana]|uniref:tyrosine-type recombinase/integrase n=1 Tax=Porphyromonas loveana TaxID=1884669 RepID=UPI0035A05F51
MKRGTLRVKLAEAEKVLLALERSGEIMRMSAADIRDRITGRNPSRLQNGTDFFGCAQFFADSKVKKATADCYRETISKVMAFDPHASFSDMTPSWLQSFDKWMSAQGNMVNTRGRYMRDIRAIFNYAIDEGITDLYPFRKFKIAKQETIKRSLTVSELSKLMAVEVEPHQERYRDMFLLSFYLVGINPVDMYALQGIRGGRIEYYRAKTGKLYSIRVEPEAQAIIDKYKGSKLLLNIGEQMQYKNFVRAQNKELKRIGGMERRGRGGKKVFAPMFPDLSIYWARHTWATIAAECDVPDDVISQALGHSTTNATTAIYIKRSLAKIDEANRKVIDYVTSTAIF